MNMPDYVWTCLSMAKYVGVCVNMSKFALMDFVLHVVIVIRCLLEIVVTYINEVYRLKEHEGVFLNRHILNFSMIARSISFVFCFGLK